jgi:hypothetical protein
VRVTVAAVAVALASAAAGSAAEFGANDDTARYAADGGDRFYARMAEVGLRQSVIGVRWHPSRPLDIAGAEQLDRVVETSARHGVEVVLALYPYPPREIESGAATPALFGAWAASVTARYPAVRQVIVGNEPNQPAFWRPQFSPRGTNVSAAAFGRLLAAAYDALKARDPRLTVVGVGLSPRGNDRPRARSNISTSPIRFLAALGRWYRSSGRTTPLMDGLSFHPYPAQATDPLERGYAWPNAGFVNLPRIKQAVWDAFHGTAQPTTVNGLRLYLDEVGWQVDTGFLDGYVGLENVPVTDEVVQAGVYADLVSRSRCDPDVAEVNFFGFYDDPNRLGFQSALHRVDGTPRPAAEAVRQVLAEETVCAPVAPWRPAAEVVGATAPWIAIQTSSIDVFVRSGEGARVVACAFRIPVSLGAARRLTAAARAHTPRSCVARPVASTATVRLRAPWVGGAGHFGSVAVRLASESNPRRVSAYVVQVR